MTKSFYIIFLIVLILLLVPVILCREYIEFDLAQYSSEFFKIFLSILTIIFSLFLTLDLQKKFDAKKKITDLADDIKEKQIYLNERIKKYLEKFKEKGKLDQSEVVDLHGTWNGSKLIAKEMEKVFYFVSDSKALSNFNFNEESRIATINEYINAIITRNNIEKIQEQEINDSILFIKERLDNLNSILKEINK